MEDRVIFISFSDAQTALIRQEMPEISVGELNTHSSTSQDNATNLKNLSDTLDGLNAFYNCSYGTQDATLVREARHRGIFVHPWTVDSQTVYEQEFFDGYHGITSNRVDYSTGYLSGVTVSAETLTTVAGAENAIPVTATAITRGGTQAIEAPAFLQLSGSAVVQQDENYALWSDEGGTAQVVLGTSFTLPANGDTYTVYSMPFTLTFEPKVIVGPSSPQEPDESDEPDVEEPETPLDPVSGFADVADDFWGKTAIDYVVAEGLMQGISETAFAPEMTTTRGMLMTILARMDGVDTTGGDSWYAKGMDWAVAQGVSDGTDPEGVITREQLAVMLYRYAGSPAVSGDALTFADADQISDWAADAVSWAVANGILSGKGNDILDAQGNATRAEVAQMLFRFSTLGQ